MIEDTKKPQPLENRVEAQEKDLVLNQPLAMAFASSILALSGEEIQTNTEKIVKKSKPSLKELGAGLDILPDIWGYAVCKGKEPFQDDWNDYPLTREDVFVELKNDRKITGYGIVTGCPVKGHGTINLDIDSVLARDWIEANHGITPTVSSASGKPGRSANFYSLNQEQRNRLVEFTGCSIDLTDANGEIHKGAYEIRYKGLFNALPPSYHPETGRYEWLNSPETTQMAECPEWIIEAAVASMKRQHGNQTKQNGKDLTSEEFKALSPVLQAAYLEAQEQKEANQEVSAWDVTKSHIMLQWLIDNAPDSASIPYEEWLGNLMALHAVDDSSEMMAKADEWSRGGFNYTEGCVAAKWDTFDSEGNATGKKSIGSFVDFAKSWGCEVPNFYTHGRDDEELNDSDFEENILELPTVESKLVIKEFFIGEWKDTNNTIPMGSKEPTTSNQYSRWVPAKQYDAERKCTLVWKEQIFTPKLDVGLEITKVLSGVDGGGNMIKLKRQENTIIEKEFFLPDAAFNSPKDFRSELAKAAQLSILSKLNGNDIYDVFSILKAKYMKKGGTRETLINKIGLQENGTYVFNKTTQFTSEGIPTTSKESGLVFNDNLLNNTDGDIVPVPNIAAYTPDCLTNLWSTLKEALGDNKYRSLLAIGATIASLHYSKIVNQSTGFGFFPIFSAYGDPQTGKTTSLQAGLSLLGLHHEGIMSRYTVSAIYEQSKLRSGTPLVWDDPPEDQKDKLEELTRNFYNASPRVVRGNTQKPNSSLIVATNYTIGDYSAAIISRLVAVFFPKTELSGTALDKLKQVQDKASGRLGDLIAIGFDKEAVVKLANTLNQYLENTDSRASINLAIVSYYALKFLELASPDDIPDYNTWLLDYCRDSYLNAEKQTNLSLFFDKCNLLLSQNKLGDWNIKQSEAYLDIWLPSVYEAVKKEFPKLEISPKILRQLLTQAQAIETNSRMVPDVDSSRTTQYAKPTKQRKVLRLPLDKAVSLGWSDQLYNQDVIDPGLQLQKAKLNKVLELTNDEDNSPLPY